MNKIIKPPAGTNPILPLEFFVPDGEAHQWPDNRIYLYGSFDIKNKASYCSTLYHVFSSPDLKHWTDHGEAFSSAGPRAAVPWTDTPLYAPDCAYCDGTYYLYFCQADNSEGVAMSRSPFGPFTQAAKIAGIEGIDPAVFIDDDKQAYYYWAQFNAKAARMKPNMREPDPATIQTNVLTEAEHHFHEGSSMRKRNGIYYYVFADIGRQGRPTCLGYAMGASPLGPFTYRGVIIDNYGCDPGVWNNHSSIAEFNGQWYVFYHRSSRGGRYSRRACVEPITFNPDGTIPEVEMTSQGVGGPIPATAQISAELACLLSGNVRCEDCPEGGEHLGRIKDNDYAVYKYIDFGQGARAFTARVASAAGNGKIEIRLDSPCGELVGTCPVSGTGGWESWETISCTINEAQGVHALYLKFFGAGENLFNVSWITFA